MSVPGSYGTMRAERRRKQLDSAALDAEWDIPAGRIGGLVRQQRRRARIANTRGMWLFGLLVLVILLGLGFYLGLPFWQQYVDGRRLTLRETAASIDTAAAQLDRDVASQRAALAEALAFSAERLALTEDEDGAYLVALQLADGSVLIAGMQNTAIRWDHAGDVPPERLDLPGEVDAIYFTALQLVDGSVLIAGTQNTAIRWDPAGDAPPERLDLAAADDVSYFTALQLADGTVLIAGTQNTAIRWDPEGNAPPERLDLPGDTDVQYNTALQLADGTVLIAGDQNTAIRWDPAGNAPPERLDHLPGGNHYTSVQLSDGKVLIAGFRSEAIRWDPDGVSPPERVDLPGEDDAITFVNPFLSPPVYYTAALQLADRSVLIAGNLNTAIRWDPAGNAPPERLDLPGEDDAVYNTALQFADGSLLLAGGEGDFSNDGIVVLISDLAAEGVPADSDEAALIAYVDGLQDHLRETVAPIRSALVTIAGKRDIIAQQKADNAARLENLPAYLLDQERQSFADFMALCRGGSPDGAAERPVPDGVASDPDAVTLACAGAWQARAEAEEGNWWQTLAQSVPPGILLLFLLATLGGLYRYNLRLAGFHHSRADALELLSVGRADETKPITDTELKNLMQVADALAADKVEFGAAKTPADQAVEIARAVVSRS